jgi:hypothetical protein
MELTKPSRRHSVTVRSRLSFARCKENNGRLVGKSAREFLRGWREWLAENLICGINTDQITAVLLRRGFDADLVSNEIRQMQKSPEIAAGRKVFKRTKKLESLLETQSRLFKGSAFASEFGERKRLTGEVFYQDYYFRNRPVVVAGWMENWKAFGTWSPESFRENFGSIEIEITAGRDLDPLYEDHCEKLRHKIIFRDYIDMMLRGAMTNEAYLVAKNYLLSRPEFSDLRSEFNWPPGVQSSVAQPDLPLNSLRSPPPGGA